MSVDPVLIQTAHLLREDVDGTKKQPLIMTLTDKPPALSAAFVELLIAI